MNWYYAQAGQQTGPVDEAQLEALVRNGTIRTDTLVWHEGMANWQPFQEVQPAGLNATATGPTSPQPAPGADQAVCAECGGIFDLQDTIQYGSLRVCGNCKPVFVQKLAEGAKLNTGELAYAGFWIRFAAKILDGLIIGIALLPPLFYFLFKNTGGFRPGMQPRGFELFQLGFLFLNLGYTIFFLGKHGATPGKMACNLKVVTAEGGKISYGRATGRFFAELLSGMICFIGYIIAGFEDQKRALHDHICSTRVIYK